MGQTAGQRRRIIGLGAEGKRTDFLSHLTRQTPLAFIRLENGFFFSFGCSGLCYWRNYIGEHFCWHGWLDNQPEENTSTGHAVFTIEKYELEEWGNARCYAGHLYC